MTPAESTLAIFAFAVCVLLSGCGFRAMSNEEIIRANKQCLEGGMRPSQIINGLNYDVIAVHCKPIEKDKP